MPHTNFLFSISKISHNHKNQHAGFVLTKYFDFKTDDTNKEDTETADSFPSGIQNILFCYSLKSCILTMKDENMA